jgi:hypothetical protein
MLQKLLKSNPAETCCVLGLARFQDPCKDEKTLADHYLDWF